MSILPSHIPYVWSIILEQSMRFFSEAVIFFPSDMVSERSIVIYLVSLILCQKCHPLKIFSTTGRSSKYLTNGRSWFTISRSSFILLAMSIFPSYIPYVWSIILDQSMRFCSKAVIFFPSDMVSERSIVIYLTHKGGHFSPKSWNIFRMLPKHMCDRPPRISYFCSQVFTNSLFP